MVSKEPAFLASAEKSSSEEAAAAERSRREAEIEEMRRIRTEREGGTSGIETTRQRLADRCSQFGPTTDLETWRVNLKNAADEDRRKKMEANQSLHEYRGRGVVIPKKERPTRETTLLPQSAADSLEEYDQKASGQSSDEIPEPGDHLQDYSSLTRNEMALDGDTVGMKSCDDQRDDSPGAVPNNDTNEQPPTETDPPPEDIPSPNGSAPVPPTYSRVDVKFSFGLIVRSSGGQGFEGENLRDNETLRRCMEATAKILLEEMPTPPDSGSLENATSYPDAYYDPEVSPSVMSIEEEKRSDKPATKGSPSKDTKRTLVKASFPVFLSDSIDDGKSAKTKSQVLKATKSTVFRALRAAVSGGSFLR